jgi:hypothetical protein
VPILPFTVSASKPSIDIRTTDLKKKDNDSVTWIGKVVGDSLSSVIFIVDKKTNLLSGEIRTEGIIYEVTTSKGAQILNTIKIITVDPSLFPSEHGPQGTLQLSLGLGPPLTLSPDPNHPPVINVMILYSPEAVAWLESNELDISAQVCIAIEHMQDHFDNNGLQVTANLVHHGQMEITQNPNLGSFLINTLLPRGTAVGDPIYEWRKLYAADIVSFWVSEGNLSCGNSYPLYPPDVNKESSAFSVVVAGCATENDSFVHEAGHLFGGNHDRYAEFLLNANVMKNSNGNFGYIKPDKNWKTVMAYDNLACPLRTITDITGQTHTGNYCVRYKYWSDPTKTLGGDQMGNPDTTTLGVTCTPLTCQGPADNASILQTSLPTVSKFRPRPGDPAGSVGNISCVNTLPPAAPTNLTVK